MKAKDKSAPKKRKRGKDEAPPAEEILDETAVKIRRLNRRDSDDQVERIMEKKLFAKYPREIIEGAALADGTTPRSMITKEVQTTKCTGEYLKATFWTRFFVKFPLQKGLAALLPDPPEGGRGRARSP